MAPQENSFRRNRAIGLQTAKGVLGGIRGRKPEFRHHVVRDLWTIAKRFGAPNVINIERREIGALWFYTVLTGPIDDPHRLLLAALAKGVEARTFFEIGTSRGYTTWTVAHNNPELRVFTLDVPPEAGAEDTAMALGSDDRRFLIEQEARGEAFRGSPEAARITELLGDSATFDFSPYENQMDFIYIDGAHTYGYVVKDTENALRMLAPGGTIAWDDYTSNPGVWQAVNEIAGKLDRPVYHVFGTRMAIYNERENFVTRRPFDSHVSIPTV